MDQPKWADITREERFFTCLLFHDIHQSPDALWKHLSQKLVAEAEASIIDVGYEICFFRDAFLVGLIERYQNVEKQTFDLALTLSSGAVVFIEAKAQQGYTTGQLQQLQSSKKRMEDSRLFPFKKIYLAGLFSSKYNPKLSTRSVFDLHFLWKDIASIYPHNAAAYERADNIYRDRSNESKLV